MRRKKSATDRGQEEREFQRHLLRVQELTENAVVQTEKVDLKVQRLRVLLHAAVSRGVQPFDFEQAKRKLPEIDLGSDATPLPVPKWEEYAPKPVSLIRRLLPFPSRRQPSLAEAEEAFAKALERYRSEEAARERRVEERRREYETTRAAELEMLRRHNAEIDHFRERVFAGDRQGVSEYYARVFEPIVDRGFPTGRRFAYVPESKLLLIEWQVPKADIVPREKEFRYNKATDSVGVHKWRSIAEVRAIYRDVLAQLALRAAFVAFGSDPASLVETLVFNGVVPDDGAARSGVQPATGTADASGTCLISMSISRRHFARLNLTNIDDAVETIRKHCGGVISAYPDEYAGVTPVLPYELADPTLTPPPPTRAPNLWTAPIEDVNRLMERLLERMGYTVAQLESSGEYLASRTTSSGEERTVVHVRRATGMLDVSQVRALQSAVRHERANAGILLTTNGLHPQAFEYAHGRPLRLYDAHAVRALCHKHDLPVRIEPADAPGPSAVAGASTTTSAVER
ncbi:restriction system protein [Thermasporomyces composti]|uniref:Restriction system protein n=1 Tax=Thermasporomyces composti TaxID=696763 RepID=A0A3D9V822_THECX|nr:restriction system protein [Thermasporomyces composti]